MIGGIEGVMDGLLERAARTVTGARGPEALVDDRDPRLVKVANDLEAVFIHHLVAALRQTVPGQGNPDAPGADLYGSLLDDHLAQAMANDMTTGIAEALYRQLNFRPTGPTMGE